jgi:hypothetical protein
MKTKVLCFVLTVVVLSSTCSIVQSAADSFEKIDNTNISVLDERTGAPTALAVIAIDLPLHGDRGLPAIPGHIVVNPATGSSISFDVFYDGLSGDFPANGSLDLHFQVTPPAGLPSTGLALSGLETSGPFPGADFGASGLLIAQWAGTHHFAMSSKGTGSKTFTSVTPSFDGVSSFFDIFADLSLPGGSSVDPTQPLFNVTLTSQSVPEPTSVVPAASGLLGLVAVACGRRQRRLLAHRSSALNPK